MEVANTLHKLRPSLDLFVLSVPLPSALYNSYANSNYSSQAPQHPQQINPSPQNFANNFPIPNVNLQQPSNPNLNFQQPQVPFNAGSPANSNYSTQQVRTFGIWIQSVEALIDSLSLSIPRRIEDNVVIWPKLGDKVSSDQSKMFYTIRSKLAEGF